MRRHLPSGPEDQEDQEDQEAASPEATSRSIRAAKAEALLIGLSRADLPSILSMLTPGATYQVVGAHALAGTSTGHEAIAEHLRTLFTRTAGTIDPVTFEDWLFGQDHVAAIVQVQMQMDRQRYRGRQLYLLRFDRDDQIDSVTVFFETAGAAARAFGMPETRSGGT